MCFGNGMKENFLVVELFMAVIRLGLNGFGKPTFWEVFVVVDCEISDINSLGSFKNIVKIRRHPILILPVLEMKGKRFQELWKNSNKKTFKNSH